MIRNGGNTFFNPNPDFVSEFVKGVTIFVNSLIFSQKKFFEQFKTTDIFLEKNPENKLCLSLSIRINRPNWSHYLTHPPPLISLKAKKFLSFCSVKDLFFSRGKMRGGLTDLPLIFYKKCSEGGQLGLFILTVKKPDKISVSSFEVEKKKRFFSLHCLLNSALEFWELTPEQRVFCSRIFVESLN